MSQSSYSTEFGITDASIEKAKRLLTYMDNLGVVGKNVRTSYDRLNSSVQSLKLSKDIIGANDAMLDIINNTGKLINSLEKVKSASLSELFKKSAKKSKGGEGEGLSFLIDAADSLFASFTKGGKKKKGKSGGLDSILGSAVDIYKSFSGSSGTKKGGGSVLDKGLKSFLPLLKKAGLKTALNPFKQFELIKMAAVGGWKIGSWINEKIEARQKEKESTPTTMDQAYTIQNKRLIEARKAGNRSDEFQALAQMSRLGGDEDKYQEYMAKSREAAKIQNQVNLNIKIDEKGRVTTETADMDTKSKVSVKRGVR